MARVTVEDCLDFVDNRFQLVLIASKRARDLADKGMDPVVEWDNDKPTVVALREIAQGKLDRDGSPIVIEEEPETSNEIEELEDGLESKE